MRFRRSYYESSADFAEINITPLVDVMLVLLAVFLTAAPFLPPVTNMVELNLPKESAAKQDAKRMDVISINSEGRYFWNNESINELDIADKLRSSKLSKLASGIQLRADTATNYGNVAKVLATAQQNGVTNIELLTQPQEQK